MLLMYYYLFYFIFFPTCSKFRDFVTAIWLFIFLSVGNDFRRETLGVIQVVFFRIFGISPFLCGILEILEIVRILKWLVVIEHSHETFWNQYFNCYSRQFKSEIRTEKKIRPNWGGLPKITNREEICNVAHPHESFRIFTLDTTLDFHIVENFDKLPEYV